MSFHFERSCRRRGPCRGFASPRESSQARPALLVPSVAPGQDGIGSDPFPERGGLVVPQSSWRRCAAFVAALMLLPAGAAWARDPLPILIRDSEEILWVEEVGSYVSGRPRSNEQDVDNPAVYPNSGTTRARVVHPLRGDGSGWELEYYVFSPPKDSCIVELPSRTYIPFSRPVTALVFRKSRDPSKSVLKFHEKVVPNQEELRAAVAHALAMPDKSPARMRDWLIDLLDASPALRKLAVEDLAANRYFEGEDDRWSECSPALTPEQRARIRESFKRSPVGDESLVGFLALAGYERDPEFDRAVADALDPAISMGDWALNRFYSGHPLLDERRNLWEWQAVELLRARVGLSRARYEFCQPPKAPKSVPDGTIFEIDWRDTKKRITRSSPSR